MKVEKKVISNLTKCYSIASLTYHGEKHFLVAAEKVDKCILFDLEGNEKSVVWNEPGGVMTMVQIPGSNGSFLATHKFYSPNDSKEAKIVIATPGEDGEWEIRTLVDLPFVHRFNVVNRNGVNYLIACALKSDHEYKDDWRFPGKVYAAVIPDDLSEFSEENQLKLEVIKDDMLRNHGYYMIEEDGIQTSIISAENGVFQFIPPENPKKKWTIKVLTEDATSDALLLDLDGDGEMELATIAPFHGDKIRIYKKKNEAYEMVYEYDDAEFAHAICGEIICGKARLIIGHRKGKRGLLSFTYDEKMDNYVIEVLDQDCGPANVYHYIHEGKDVLISANRETDEVAQYLLS